MSFSVKFKNGYYRFVMIIGYIFLVIALYMGFSLQKIMGLSPQNLPTSVMLFLAVFSFILAFLDLISLVIKNKLLSAVIMVIYLVMGYSMFSIISIDLISEGIVDITINAFTILALGTALVAIGARGLKETDDSGIVEKRN